MTQKTTVKIDRLSVPLFIGILDHEREAAQTVTISIDMGVNIPERPSESGQDYVSYAPIVEYLLSLSKSGRHIDLVEELADEIFGVLFNDSRVERVRIEVIKPEIFPQAAGVGVIIERINPKLDAQKSKALI